MANQEHIALLKQGVDAWNVWRQEHRDTVPDLHAADLSEADLHAADLGGADLSEADLGGADLRRADLSLADLSLANLRGANLRGANLCEANLSGAGVYEKVFADTNLTATKGLDSCKHAGPSTLDHRTLQRSGTLSSAFLRGCGLPDNLIAYLPSLLNQPIQFYSCFISYSSTDDEFAKRLYADLQNKDVRCWFAPEDMKIGDKIRTRIDEVIRVHQKLLLVLSQHSINSAWVEKEVETAFEKEREGKKTVLFPVRLDDAIMESKTGWAGDIKRTRHIGDFCNWKEHDAYQESLQRLLRDLRIERERENGAS